MENRSPSVVAGLIAALLLPLAALADSGPDAARQADWDARLDRAAAMVAESKAKQEAAMQLLDEKNQVCDKKFLVNACRNEARKDYLKTTHEAHRQESEGKALEREVKKEQIADREKRKAEEAPQRAADLQERQAETEAARRATEAKIEATQAGKAQKAAEGEKRKAAEAEKHRRKLEAHDRKVAEKVRETEKREQEGANK